MREEGLRPRRRAWRPPRTTQTDPTASFAPNLLNQNFQVDAPNQAWVADITYLRVSTGFVYLAVVLDLFSRKVVGWAVADHLRTELVLDALEQARATRNPAPGLIHHSDRGCQYTSAAFRATLADFGATSSMSRTGNCYDNAVAESFFGTLKQEWVRGRTFADQAEAVAEMSRYIDDFYNLRRRHSFNEYVSPVRAEEEYRQAA